MEQVDIVAMGDPEQNENEQLQEGQGQDTAVQRQCPLFGLGLVELQRLWDELKAKEVKYQHSLALFEHHPDLDSQKRAILLSWLSEVCEVYHLRRETYYLCVELVDRFFLHSADIGTSHLQMTGVTALMLAAKMEEITPPKGQELAYVTDGACEWSDIRAFELFMSEKLSWTFTAPTPNTWLQFYLQTAAVQSHQTTQTASLDSVSAPSQNLRNPDANWDMSALEEHTKTIQLAREDNTIQSVYGSVCERVASHTIAEGSEGCEGFCENENINCEKNEGCENKENEADDENCVNNVQEQMNDKVRRNISEKNEQGNLNHEGKLNLVNPHAAKGDGTMYKNDEEIHNNKQEEKMLEDVNKINIYDCDNAKDSVHDMWRTHLDPIEEEVCSKSQIGTADEDDEMEDMCFEEVAEEHSFLEPLHSPELYVKASQLMDLVMLDSNSLRFRYSVLAAAVMFHCGCCEDIYQLTGLAPKEADPCIEWMQIHKTVMETSPQRESWGTPLQLDCQENMYAMQNCFVLDSMWKMALNISDLYFTSEEDRTAVLEHIQLEHFV